MPAAMAREPFNPELVEVPTASPGCKPGHVTVSQVTAMVRRALDDALPSTLHVIGEISNFKRHGSGHLYFTLKDESSELSCVMWRSEAAKLAFAPADGLEVIATGRVEVFERAGRYQLYTRKLEPRGVGALELAFRQLREKLAAEGLFDLRHKQPIPKFPERIVLVTSPTGAAIADMIRTIERRFPCVHLLLQPVRVQGEGAAAEIAAAIRKINTNATALGEIDLMIVGRGGGSLEDLWAFNEEVVARAIFASRIPIISAVGHEVDVSIADLVADVRAATPTAAAELAVPVLDEVLGGLDALQARFARSLASRLNLLQTRLAGISTRGAFRDPFATVFRRDQLLDELSTRMYRRLVDVVAAYRRHVEHVEPAMVRIAPHRYLLAQSLALQNVQHRLRMAAGERVNDGQRHLGAVTERLERVSPIRETMAQSDRVERIAEVMSASIRHRFAMAVARLEYDGRRLSAVGHESVLRRGFSVTRKKKGRTLIRSAKELSDGDRVVTQLADGEFESDVVNLNQLELFD